MAAPMNKPFCLLSLALSVFAAAASADPLVGRWVLNVGRSHYGGGAEVRKQETFTCSADGRFVRCAIESERLDGGKVSATFAAAYDGKSYPVSGIRDVDRVSLKKAGDRVADATFRFRGRPVFGYRAVQSDDGRSLTVVSVDPVSRVVLNSVVVYDRRP